MIMKAIIHWLFALIIALAVFSCGTTRKVQTATYHETSVDSLTKIESSKEETTKVVDTTRTEHGTVVITEIEFYPPATPLDPIEVRNKAEPTTEQATPPTPVNNIQGVGNVHGAIKSIKQTVIENEVEQKGQSEESNKQEESKSNALVSKSESEKTVEKQTETTPNRRLHYVGLLALVAVGVLLYIKRAPILNFIRMILSGIRRIL